MSAYGAITAPAPLATLTPLSWPLTPGLTLTTHPISHKDVPQGLLEYLHGVFQEELAGGKSYPQEGPISFEAFETYFFTSASTTIIGILHEGESEGIPDTVEEARGDRSWEECTGGCYYIKPNYPGRSSHLCNAGFIVPPIQRGKKIGKALATSFLEYAPKLGYRGSVFNLVFKNNAASLRLWDTLGFSRIGVIPGAGRLKSGPGGEEEYVDAVVVYKSFL